MTRVSIATRRKPVSVSVILTASLIFGCSTSATLESGTYETILNGTVMEYRDSNGYVGRILPRSATITFDLETSQPSMIAVIHDDVLRHIEPSEHTVTNLSGTQLEDEFYHFTGNYGGNYGGSLWYDWKFSSISNGIVLWKGNTYWGGGAVIIEYISGIALQADPPKYRAESIYIENPSFENGLAGWTEGFGGEVLSPNPIHLRGLMDGTNSLLLRGAESGTTYRAQTLSATILPNSIYVLEAMSRSDDAVLTLKAGPDTVLAEAQRHISHRGYIFNPVRLTYVVPPDHESIGSQLKISLGKLDPSAVVEFDHIRLTRYTVSPELILKLLDENIIISATNLTSGVDYTISSAASLTNPPPWETDWMFSTQGSFTNFTESLPTNTSRFYKLKQE